MTQKTISLFTAAGILAAYLWSQLQPSGALFLLMSPNTAINVGWLVAAALMVRLSFTDRFKTQSGYIITAALSALAILIGGIGLFASGFNYLFFSWFGPIDFLLLAQLGVILGICALSYQHQPVKLSALTFKRPKILLPKPALSVPRLAMHSLRNLRSAN